MYSIRLSFCDEYWNKLFEYEETMDEERLVINDDYIYDIFSDKENTNKVLNKVFCLGIVFVSKNMDLIIKEQGYIKKVTIESVSDSERIIGVLRAENIELDIGKCDIGYLFMENGGIGVHQCKIKNFSFNSSEYSKKIREKSIRNKMTQIENEISTLGKNEKLFIEVYESDIKKMTIHNRFLFAEIWNSEIESIEYLSNEKKVLNIESIRLLGGKVNNFALLPYEGELVKFDVISIENGCRIETLKINCSIDKFVMKETAIHRFYFAEKTKIQNLCRVKSFCDNIYGCEENNFGKLGIEEYKMIKQSAFGEDEQLYFDASYKLAELKWNKALENRNIKKFLNWFFKKSIGYGYRPEYAYKFIINAIMKFGLLYFIINAVAYFFDEDRIISFKEGLMYAPLKFFESCYFSGITFTTTGYGDITPNVIVSVDFTNLDSWKEWIVLICNVGIKVLVILESCLGVTMFALLIYSLTIRHLSYDKELE